MQIIFMCLNGNHPFPIYLYLKQLEMLSIIGIFDMSLIFSLPPQNGCFGYRKMYSSSCEEDLSVLVDHRESMIQPFAAAASAVLSCIIRGSQEMIVPFYMALKYCVQFCSSQYIKGAKDL